MGNRLREMREVLREQPFAMKAVATRKKKQRKTAADLGLKDPYPYAKKKKKKNTGGIRGFMDKFIKSKEKKMGD